MRDDDPQPQVVLPEPVRDHLGQQLRTVYTVDGGKPQYLGDDVLPQEFEPQIKRLETRLKTHEEGTVAVEHALDRILDAFGVQVEADKDAAREPQGDRSA
ncbi:hypothetical protein [Methylobacterium soli]|uniref:Uncharacterized protein n=1 Tax=Methylobacterium soli TaxID=553447 RepID=A0A6L3SZ18_9HYPH|nr:hypothetical protein [Methylobacterium soli]KAB1078855.1 hypothetical protein F6X53_12640 [Methylobacterium soli]GJE44371.1 hypothetical protein AEGHOMDF_3559 [Methylobacterium soli]